MKNLRHLCYLFILILLWQPPDRFPPLGEGQGGLVYAATINGSFEEDLDADGRPDGWGWPAGDWIWDNTVFHTGAYSAKVSRFEGPATASLWSPDLPVAPSTTYTFSYWLRTEEVSRRPNVILFQYNSSGAQLGSRYLVYVTVSGTTDWQQITYRFQSASEASYVRFRIDAANAQTGTYWFDDFDLIAGEPALYPIKPGFPLETPDWIETSAPVVADIDNDGANELLAADYRGRIHAWTGTGQLKPGFFLNTGGHIIGHMALGDLDRDGDLEIVAGVGSVNVGEEGRVFAWNADGSLLPGWPQTVARWPGHPVVSKVPTVVLADLDNDQDLEVIAGTNNNNLTTDFSPLVPNLYAWHHTGEPAAGQWPIEDPFDAAILGPLGAGDLNNDGQTDIITGRDYQSVFAYDAQGNSLPGWPVLTRELPSDTQPTIDHIVHRFSAPVLADIDLDGIVDYIVAGQRRHVTTHLVHTTNLMVLQPDGARHPNWLVPAGGQGILSNDIWMQQAPAVADLNGDTRLDIIVPTQDGWIRAYAPDQTLLWEFNYAQGAYIYASEPVVGDIDGDGLYEVAFGTYDPNHGAIGPVGLWILENDGSVKPGAPFAVGSSGIQAAPTLADLDNDQLLEIVAATNVGQIYVWETDTPFDPTRFPWPVARHNLQRTASLPAGPSLGTSFKTAIPVAAEQGDEVTLSIQLIRTGPLLTETVRLTDTIPAGLSYIPGSLTATSGTVDESLAPVLHWTGFLADLPTVEISYRAIVVEEATASLISDTVIDAGRAGRLNLVFAVIANGIKTYFPTMDHEYIPVDEPELPLP